MRKIYYPKNISICLNIFISRAKKEEIANNIFGLLFIWDKKQFGFKLFFFRERGTQKKNDVIQNPRFKYICVHSQISLQSFLPTRTNRGTDMSRKQLEIQKLFFIFLSIVKQLSNEAEV